MGQSSQTPGSQPCSQARPVLLSLQQCSPPMRLSSLSWYLLHIWRLFSSSLQEMGRQSGTECGLGDAGPMTQPRGTRVVTVPEPGLQAVSSSVGLIHCLCPSQHLREVVQGVCAGPWAHQHTVHLAVQPVEEEPQELLRILLAARHGAWLVSGGRGSGLPRHPRTNTPYL